MEPSLSTRYTKENKDLDVCLFEHRLALALQHARDLVRARGVDGQHHAQTVVERAGHLAGLDVAAEPGEDGGPRPGGDVNLGSEVGRQHARDVLDEAAAGDVGHAADGVGGGGEGGEQRADVDAGRGEQGVAERGAGLPGAGVGVAQAAGGDDAADEREAVRVHARGGEAEQDVARPHGVLARQALGGPHDADGGAGGVVVVARVEVRHLGGLAADEGAAGLDAALGDALDEGGGDGDVEAGAAIVVEEHDGLGALDDEVVDVHGDEVDADRVVLVHRLRDDQLGADAVDGADDDGRARVPGGGQVNFAAEAADDGVSAWPAGRGDSGLDAVDELVAGIDAHAGLRVSELDGGFGGAEGAVGDVPAVVHALKVNQLDALVGLVDGGPQRVADGVGGDDAAARSQQRVARELRAGVEEGDVPRRVGNPHGDVLGVGRRVARGGDDHGRTELGRDLDRDVLEAYMILAKSDSSRGSTVCVSGSPKRTLYSSTLGVPSGAIIRPVKRQPRKGKPSLRMPSMVGWSISRSMRAISCGVASFVGA
ncbi:b2f4a9d5-c3f3-4041-b835-429105f02bbc [Thermothielavioides terrestris]|uniref:B2f4a9d5-c3f3-4041-b835-429105f02bbc n=1 Tax=Thermothielavioides terrestris TaxID=2587410 RepID=A0A3S4F6I4_9PEZI|nr:b2f4a9d5-c3f3-4041-b835-429105f02bbc [Thermothielavioides terrestris]